MDDPSNNAHPPAESAGGSRAESQTASFVESFDLSLVPTAPGCYLMRDSQGQVIYVGKAKNLRARLRSYINEQDSRYSVKFLMARVANIEFLVTSTDKEAMLLENSLIKEHAPRYNMKLKADNTYITIRLNLNHPFPRLTVGRERRDDGHRYFGPYTDSNAARQTIRQLQKVFPLRKCSDAVLNNRSRPCLYYQMGQCVAPCVDYVTPAAYRVLVEQVSQVLQGRSDEVERQLRQEMQARAEALEFEEAAALRDKIRALRETLERQRTVAMTGPEDRDILGIYAHGRYCELQVLSFREGKMLGGEAFSFNQREMPLDDVIENFALQYYGKGRPIPNEVVVPCELENADTLSELLSEQKGRKVSVLHPKRGDKVRLVEMANRNARKSFDEKRLEEEANSDLLEQTRLKLGLVHRPGRIECFDMSTIQGKNPVGAMVVFDNGEANKKRYRHFAIREAKGQDDFAMMREVILRRYQRAAAEDDLPGLVLIDGGKGQLNVAVTALRDLGLEDLEVASIAKARAEEGGGHSPERFFRPGRKNPIILPQNSPVVHFLARVRDEAHRFVITYHRKRRKKSALRTSLLEIPGIGPQRARTLLTKVGGIARIRTATEAEIAGLPGFNETLARTVKEHLGNRDRNTT